MSVVCLKLNANTLVSTDNCTWILALFLNHHFKFRKQDQQQYNRALYSIRMNRHLHYWDHVFLLRPVLYFLEWERSALLRSDQNKKCIKCNTHWSVLCKGTKYLLTSETLNNNLFCNDFSVNLCIVPVPGHLAPILADSQPAGSWSGWLQHTHSSLDLDRRCPTGLFLVPAATHKHITTNDSKTHFYTEIEQYNYFITFLNDFNCFDFLL